MGDGDGRNAVLPYIHVVRSDVSEDSILDHYSTPCSIIGIHTATVYMYALFLHGAHTLLYSTARYSHLSTLLHFREPILQNRKLYTYIPTYLPYIGSHWPYLELFLIHGGSGLKS